MSPSLSETDFGTWLRPGIVLGWLGRFVHLVTDLLADALGRRAHFATKLLGFFGAGDAHQVLKGCALA